MILLIALTMAGLACICFAAFAIFIVYGGILIYQYHKDNSKSSLPIFAVVAFIISLIALKCFVLCACFAFGIINFVVNF